MCLKIADTEASSNKAMIINLLSISGLNLHKMSTKHDQYCR